MVSCFMSAEFCRSRSPPLLGVRLHQRQRSAREKPNVLAVYADKFALWQLT